MTGILAQAQQISFPPSAFVPLAVGFFGLGTGYLIYGPQELLKLPVVTAPWTSPPASGASGCQGFCSS
jgi:hypothetical protein